jgi:hypothetical protein
MTETVLNRSHSAPATNIVFQSDARRVGAAEYTSRRLPSTGEDTDLRAAI